MSRWVACCDFFTFVKNHSKPIMVASACKELVYESNSLAFRKKRQGEIWEFECTWQIPCQPNYMERLVINNLCLDKWNVRIILFVTLDSHGYTSSGFWNKNYGCKFWVECVIRKKGIEEQSHLGLIQTVWQQRQKQTFFMIYYLGRFFFLEKNLKVPCVKFSSVVFLSWRLPGFIL